MMNPLLDMIMTSVGYALSGVEDMITGRDELKYLRSINTGSIIYVWFET